jgi:hypothetical protein
MQSTKIVYPDKNSFVDVNFEKLAIEARLLENVTKQQLFAANFRMQLVV